MDANGQPTAWVVGAGGLLGSAVVAHLRGRGRTVRTVAVPWGTTGAEPALVAAAAALGSGPVEVYWCAGAGVVGSAQADLDAEVAALTAFLGAWPSEGAGSALFLASSAGGVYAGSAGPPFTEDTVPRPLAAYGHAKLAGEAVARDFAERTGTALLVGRISNLYGPGQDVTKPQGLISHLCRAQQSRTPINVYVSVDTLRDYLYADDAAVLVGWCLGEVRRRGGVHVKILAAEQSVSIGALIGALHRVSRRRPPVVFGASPNARFQVHDLRLRSTAWPPTADMARTPLPVGMSATLESVGRQLRAGS